MEERNSFGSGICIIEWGEKISNLLPKDYLLINISKNDETLELRDISFIPFGNKYFNLAKEIFENENFIT